MLGVTQFYGNITEYSTMKVCIVMEDSADWWVYGVFLNYPNALDYAKKLSENYLNEGYSNKVITIVTKEVNDYESI